MISDKMKKPEDVDMGGGGTSEPSQTLVLELRPDFTENLGGRGSPGPSVYRTPEGPRDLRHPGRASRARPGNDWGLDREG